MPRWRRYLLWGTLLACVGCSHHTATDARIDAPEPSLVILPSLDPSQTPHVGWTWTSLLSATRAADSTSFTSFMHVDGQLLVIDKSFLSTPLVLMPTLTESTVLPEPMIWENTNVVFFERIENTLYLLESAEGKFPHTTARTPETLAHFPIVRETENDIAFDFQAGALSDLIVSRTANVDASAANQALLSAPPAAAQATGSYIRTSNSGDGWFSVEQVVNFRSTGQDIGAVFRFTFWLASQSTMQPLIDDPKDDIGYFNLKRYKPGNTDPIYIARRWRTDRPLTLYISSNTPDRFRAAIRDGALAWNTIFAWDFIHVDDAPPGVTPGDPRFPLIQWIENSSGSARGMSFAHPVTGEQLAALITIREGWTKLHMTEHLTNGDDPAHNLPFTFNGFAPAVQCDDEFAGWDDGWTDGALSTLDAPTQDRIAQLQLRAVVMHEVGHVLGLRHNFAGSLDNQIKPQFDRQDVQTAITGTRAPNAPLPSSSIMDYLIPSDDIRMTLPGRYDLKAISWGYEAAWQVPETDPANANMIGPPWTYITDVHFCSEEDTSHIADCVKHDSGREPLDWWARELEVLAHSYSSWLLANVVLPPEQMQGQLGGIGADQHWLLKRMGRSFVALNKYTSAAGWVLYGTFPIERAARANHILSRYFFHGYAEVPFDPVAASAQKPDAFSPHPVAPGTPAIRLLAQHPFVRSPLKEKILTLEELAKGLGGEAAWAAQVLHDLQNELRLTEGYVVTQFI